jgi:CDP-diacylglycerol--serine O-phosphatidyltransferase
METPLPPAEPTRPTDEARGPRLREIPLRLMVPNLITVLAICAGLTGIRLAFEERYELAVAMVLLAAFLDGIDGRVARLLKATSNFGVQMDSLADIINFGVAPALVSYAFLLHDARSLGWIAALLYAIAAGLRLARFNVMAERQEKAPWQSEFFVGVPAPMGAMLVLLPVYLGFLGVEPSPVFVYLSVAYTVGIGYLLASRLPVWSGKSSRIRRDMMFPILLGVVLYVALLMSYTWEVLSLTVIAYMLVLPFSARAWHRRYGTITIEDDSTHV